MSEQRTVNVNLGPDQTDWEEARRIVQDLYPKARLGQMSRTAAYPDCNDDCDEECGHGYVMRYTVKVVLP